MRKEKKGNHMFRMAMLNCIDKTLFDKTMEYVNFEPNTYANESDMVHFMCDGHKCRLLSVERPNISAGTIIMSVGVENELLRLNFDISHFRCKTLERIANEVYDYLKLEDWDDWETFEKNMVANTFDELASNL